MRASDQELAKGNEVFKLPQVQPRAKQVAGQTVRSRRIIADDREDISAKPILSYFSRQAHPLGGVVRERSSRPVIVEISEGISGSEIDVAVHSRDVVPRYEIAGMYSYINFAPGDPFANFNNHGATGSFTYNASKWVGLTGEVGEYRFSRNIFPIIGNNSAATDSLTSYLFGPRLNLRKFEHFVPFGEFNRGPNK